MVPRVGSTQHGSVTPKPLPTTNTHTHTHQSDGCAWPPFYPLRSPWAPSPGVCA